ncbi:type IV pilin N-terminal domain-containing protein [Methanocorpusculum sp. MG]|uniref:Type IV pilin N-terminal domain-containing protein n=1 Tax=Methanocorpusculum petauri TaxID=3002863 RepID=A0ABT4IF44_9EURY|nr:type IV pilin N-terminal domain-containing protein [Methanocorpusculum petauri]MCZ0860357.1 type IV pilin N-terminal domain-containing protein [Methanocorpusculum petauri]MDE2444184.1 type IV pilin N-terminal domain-containing protein [Methanocorpusculum sp.]
MRIPRHSDDAVSPVIATILLVLITVVFLAVVGMVLISLTDDAGSARSVGLIVKPSRDSGTGVMTQNDGIPVTVTVTLTGGADAAALTSLTVAVSDPLGSGSSGERDTRTCAGIGVPMTFTIDDLDGYSADRTGGMRCLVTVTGRFTDGSSSVLYQNMVTV